MTFVAVTGFGQEQDRQEARDAGFNGHLVKPVSHEDLARLLAPEEPRDDGHE
jgi:CheY-like chemotaxis protein